jgi:hypothetical protein
MITLKFKQAVQNLKPIASFSAIGDQIGRSRQFVSHRMQERFKDNFQSRHILAHRPFYLNRDCGNRAKWRRLSEL